ncbi:MAG: hypothetical protein WC678_03480 [Parcubacteria group bacterium]|jgi:hypothetical protein
MVEKNKSTSILVFIINALLLGIGFLVIKNKDNNRLLAQKEALLNVGSIDPKILETQNAISSDREAKLNSQNTAIKETKKVDNVTAKTTTTSAPVPAKKTTTKTKTS